MMAAVADRLGCIAMENANKMRSPLAAPVVQTQNVPMPNTVIAALMPVVLQEAAHGQMARRIATAIVPMENTVIADHALVALQKTDAVPMVRLKVVPAQTLRALMRQGLESCFSRKDSTAPLSTPLTADFKPP